MSSTVSEHKIPMAPTGSITWERVDVPDGILYLPPEGDNREMAQLLQSGAVGDLIGSGKSGGNVYEVPSNRSDLVIKEFTPRIICNKDVADRGGLPALRANVMLATGLSMLEQRRGAWRIDGAPILGALVMHESVVDPAVHARWIIKKATPLDGPNASWFMPMPSQHRLMDSKGHTQIKSGRTIKPEQKPFMPSPKKRHNLYDDAMAAANGSPIKSSDLLAGYDDHPGNMILTEMPVMNGRKTLQQGKAIKLDVQPIQGFDF